MSREERERELVALERLLAVGYYITHHLEDPEHRYIVGRKEGEVELTTLEELERFSVEVRQFARSA